MTNAKPYFNIFNYFYLRYLERKKMLITSYYGLYNIENLT